MISPFCSIFHRWEDWIDSESEIQIRWCKGCNKRQKRLVKLVQLHKPEDIWKNPKQKEQQNV